MAQFDLVCSSCGRSFVVVTEGRIEDPQKRCPECGSEFIRQTMASYLRNGPLSNPDCGLPGCTAHYG